MKGRTNMHLPVLPLQYMAVHLEADALGLDDVEGLHVSARVVAALLCLFHQIWEEIPGLAGWGNSLALSSCKGVGANGRRSSTVGTEFHRTIRGANIDRRIVCSWVG